MVQSKIFTKSLYLSRTNKEIVQNTNSEPKKFSILCTFKFGQGKKESNNMGYNMNFLKKVFDNQRRLWHCKVSITKKDRQAQEVLDPDPYS